MVEEISTQKQVNLLNIANRVPWPLKDGGAIALYRQIEAMASLGVEVDLISVMSKTESLNPTIIQNELKELCGFQGIELNLSPGIWGALRSLLLNSSYNIDRFKSRNLRFIIRKQLNLKTYDLVQFESIFMAPYLNEVQKLGIPVVLREHNVEFEIWERRAALEKNPVKKAYLKILARQLKSYELKMISRFHAVVCITEADKQTLLKHGCNVPVHVYEAGLGLHQKQGTIRHELRHKLYHIGSMDWVPNRLGVHWFTENCWPLIRKALPQSELHLAGKGMSEESDSGQNGIVKHGEVTSAAHFIAEQGICIVPIQSGSGLRIKILEAMMAGKAVVSTQIGAQGLKLEAGTHYLEANDPETFLQCLLKLQDPMVYTKLCEQAQKDVWERYRSDSLTSDLLQFYRYLIFNGRKKKL